MQAYEGVNARFLRDEERLVLSAEKEMPLVIEANEVKDTAFLQSFLKTNSDKLQHDLARYGAILFRGFEIDSDHAFEKTMLSIPGFRGISEAFMSEEGRIHVDDLKYVLHTNAVYKTGGTLYLGGFHSENYYNPDVPSYIAFCCLKPSLVGGETGLVNMANVYEKLDNGLKARLEEKPFFVAKWLLSEVCDRYQVSSDMIKKLCTHFSLPIIGEGEEKAVLMYKPSVFLDPKTNKKALQINQFELPGLNSALRKLFAYDYQGPAWRWHRFVWKLPRPVFKTMKFFYVICSSFFYSPKDALKIAKFKYRNKRLEKKLPNYPQDKVASCFNSAEIKQLASLVHENYASCIWKAGDILWVDNKQVVHAGMPGTGSRQIRALIGNPLEMQYTTSQAGLFECKERDAETVGFYADRARL